MKSFNTFDNIRGNSTEIVEETADNNISILNMGQVSAMTRGWQCCKCKETMYDDEMNCTWNRCNHRRCSNCRSFSN
jgi:hypothetical protein